jgi:DNA invertase Pin-like site-specific DNA recombinase
MASGNDLTASDDPTRKMMRQIAGAFAEYEKARLVSKLRHARDRVRQEKGKCEGRKPHGELRPEAVALAKRLHRARPQDRQAHEPTQDRSRPRPGRSSQRAWAAIQP